MSNAADIETGAPVLRVETASRTEMGQIGFRAPTGRCRWMPDGKAIAYLDQNDAGEVGVYVQEFAPARNTYATRRPVAGFNPNKFAESFGISPDGAFITLAEMEVLSSLVLAENIPGLAR